jgi:dienelactone hydrolase
VRKRRALRSAALALVTTVALGACSSGSSSRPAAARATTTTEAPLAVRAAYAKPGPYPVSFHTLRAGNRPIDVFLPGQPGSEKGHKPAWYDIRAPERPPNAPSEPTAPSEQVTIPAYANLPPAFGPFPVVLFSHGYGAQPLVNATLEANLAAWGFVVIAPDHLERDTYALIVNHASINDARDANVLQSAMLAAARDPAVGPYMNIAQIAAVGHSQGGATALAALALPDIRAAVAWASTSPTRPLVAKPVMLIGAQHDLKYGANVQQNIYAHLPGRGAIVLLGAGAGHATFVDECEGLWSSGQLVPGGDVPNAQNPGGVLELAQNGCYPDEVEPAVAWPVITHFTVAFLRSVFGIDRQPVGLSDGIARAFPKVPLTYEHRP